MNEGEREREGKNERKKKEWETIVRFMLKTDVELSDWGTGVRGSFFIISVFVLLKFSAM